MGSFDDYASRPVPVAGTTYEVLSRSPDGTVRARAIVLHELPGATSTLERFADELVVAGIEVHVPLLFGRRGALGVIGMIRGAICLRRELSFFASRRTGGLAGWLDGLVDEVAATDDGAEGEPGPQPPIGVVGMCMTGGIVLATMAHPQVSSVVSSQPTLPFALPFSPHHVRADLGIGAGERDDAAASETPLTCLRFRDDRRCPDERIEAVKETFGTRSGRHVRDGPVTVSAYGRLTVIEAEGGKHSVLTGDRVPEAVDRVVAFLLDPPAA